MNKVFSLISLITFCLIGCTSSPSFTDVSKYNLVSDALVDGEQVKIIAAAISQDRKTDAIYYNVFVAVSQKTGDTVNILIDVDPGVRESDTGRVYNYISEANPLYRMLKSTMNEVQGKGESKERRVVYSSELDRIVNINKPTVIGMVGTVGSMTH